MQVARVGSWTEDYACVWKKGCVGVWLKFCSSGGCGSVEDEVCGEVQNRYYQKRAILTTICNNTNVHLWKSKPNISVVCQDASFVPKVTKRCKVWGVWGVLSYQNGIFHFSILCISNTSGPNEIDVKLYFEAYYKERSHIEFVLRQQTNVDLSTDMLQLLGTNMAQQKSMYCLLSIYKV